MRRSSVPGVVLLILMTLVMVMILYFGYEKLTEINSMLSQSEIKDVKLKIFELYHYCEDPLNRGDVKIVDVKSSKVGVICLIGQDVSGNYLLDPFDTSTSDKLNLITSSDGSNVIIGGVPTNSTGKLGFPILAAFKVNIIFHETRCFLSKNGVTRVKIRC